MLTVLEIDDEGGTFTTCLPPTCVMYALALIKSDLPIAGDCVQAFASSLGRPRGRGFTARLAKGPI